MAVTTRPHIAKDERDHSENITSEIPKEIPKKQWWWRPNDSKTRKLAEKISIMRAAGRKNLDIAKRLNTTEGTIQQAIYVARKNGWWDKEDGFIDLEVELSMNIDRKIVRNVSASLDGAMTNYQTHEMTIAAAKGRGIFKNHEISKQEGGAVLGMIGLTVIMPPLGADDQKIEISDAMCGGVPSYVDGEVSDGAGQHGPVGQEALPERTGGGDEG